MSSRQQDGTAPLWIASQMGHSEVVRVMLLRGAERDAARNVSLSHSCGLWARRGWGVGGGSTCTEAPKFSPAWMCGENAPLFGL